MTAGPNPFSQVQSVQAQAELATARARVSGSKGTTGFTGMGIDNYEIQQLVDARGVPPRGSPV